MFPQRIDSDIPYIQFMLFVFMCHIAFRDGKFITENIKIRLKYFQFNKLCFLNWLYKNTFNQTPYSFNAVLENYVIILILLPVKFRKFHDFIFVNEHSLAPL